jgi:hypothetical protein
MGDAIRAASGAMLHVDIHVAHAAGAKLVVLLDGKPYAPSVDTALGSADQHVGFDWHSDGKRHWLRAEVRSTLGIPLLIGNPIYVNAD